MEQSLSYNDAINITTQNNFGYSTSALVLSGVSCSLSIIGGVVIFATYFAIPEIRNVTRKLVLCLTTADMISAVGYLVSVVRYSTMDNPYPSVHNSTEEIDFCTVQGTITAYSSLVSFFLTVVIAVHILATVVSRRNRTGTTLWMVGFNIVSWGVPAIVVAMALFNRMIGEENNAEMDTGPWCWIKLGSGDNKGVWMWIAGKGWEVACYLLTATLYITLKFYLYRRHYKERFRAIQSSLRDEDKNFLYVWLILYVIRVWGTLRFFLIVYNNNKPEKFTKALMYMQAFGDPAQAFCNFFLFCVFDSTIRSKFCQMCSRGKPDPETEPIINNDTLGDNPETDRVPEDQTGSQHTLRDASHDTSSQSDYGTLSPSDSKYNSVNSRTGSHRGSTCLDSVS